MGVAQQACEVRAGVVVGVECWRMHCVTFGVVECFVFRVMVVDFRWASGGQWVCCCEWGSVRNKVVLVCV